MKKITIPLILGMLAVANAQSIQAESDCKNIFKESSASFSEVKDSDKKVVALVKDLSELHPQCSSAIIKASIVSSQADKDLVKQIIEAAIIAAPEQINAIVNSGIAMAPDTASDIVKIASQFSNTQASSEALSIVHLGGGKNSTGKNGGKNGGDQGQGGAAPEQSFNNAVSFNPLDTASPFIDPSSSNRSSSSFGAGAFPSSSSNGSLVTGIDGPGGGGGSTLPPIGFIPETTPSQP